MNTIKNQLYYCYKTFGTDCENFVLDRNNNKLEFNKRFLFGKRGPVQYMKAEKVEKGIQFTSIHKSDVDKMTERGSQDGIKNSLDNNAFV